jgi:uncharacterized membrane protein
LNSVRINWIWAVFICIDAWIFEYIVLHIYGAVAYPKTTFNIGGIPILVVLGWTLMLTFFLKVVKATSIFNKALIVGLAMTGVDFVLEPFAVQLHLWRWNSPVGYGGIPVENYFAWFLYSMLVVYSLEKWGHTLSIKNLVKIFISITGMGLAIGHVWHQLDISVQQIIFPVIIIGAVVKIISSGDIRKLDRN